MEECLILTSSKEAAGMSVIDVRTGSAVCSGFKNCIAEAGAMCMIGSSTSSYSGYGSAGDYIAVAQSKKPCINIWQWGKPQAHFQCHIQEIVTALACDSLGGFLYAGTTKGWIYCWELATGELISAFQAHFKAITRLNISSTGVPFCISVSEDGTGRAWELHKVLDSAESYKHVGRQSITPFRSWSAHTLPIKDCILFDTLTTTRVLTCSLDRTIVLYDVLQAQVCLRVSLPHSLESLACNPTQDLVCAGASNGSVYIIDMTSTAIAVTAAHAHVSHHLGGAAAGAGLPVGTSVLEGHSKAVTGLAFSRDNSSLISASMDGTVRVWNVWTRQCLREYSPLAKHGITNAKLIPVPETLGLGVTRPTYCPVAHLNKYFKGQQTLQGGAGQGLGQGQGQSGGGDGQQPAASAGGSGFVLGPSFLGRHGTSTVPIALGGKRFAESSQQPNAPRSKAQRLSQETVHAEPIDEVNTVDMEDDRTAGEEQVVEEEDYMALSGSFLVPKKPKRSSTGSDGRDKKRKSSSGAGHEDQQAAQVEESKGPTAVELQLQEALAQAETLRQELQRAQQQLQTLSTPSKQPVSAQQLQAQEQPAEGSAKKKAKASPVAPVASPVATKSPSNSVHTASPRAAQPTVEAAEVTVEEELVPSSPVVQVARDRANRRKSVAPAGRGKKSSAAAAPKEDEEEDVGIAGGSAFDVAPVPADVEVPAVEEQAEVTPTIAATKKDRANRRKSVGPGKLLPLPVIEEDAPLNMPAEEAAPVGASDQGSIVKRSSRRKSGVMKEVPPTSPSTTQTATTTAAAEAASAAVLRTPPGVEDSDMESILSVGGTRSRVKKSVQFSGQDQVKLITPHKLPGFCDSFQNGVGSASKVAAMAAAAAATAGTGSGKKAGKGGKGKK